MKSRASSASASPRRIPIGYRDDLVAAFTYLPKLCSHIHFPMQSGSDRILREMRRPYKNEKFIEICEKMKAARPGLAITTDIIVGFPGETEEDFQATIDTVERLQFDNAFVFRYSKRRNTPAAEMDGQLDESVKEERNQRLLAVVDRLAIASNAAARRHPPASALRRPVQNQRRPPHRPHLAEQDRHLRRRRRPPHRPAPRHPDRGIHRLHALRHRLSGRLISIT